MIGWYIDYPYRVRILIQLQQKYIFVPPFIGQGTHPYMSLYDRGVFYIFHVD